jgi:hypothetical protein
VPLLTFQCTLGSSATCEQCYMRAVLRNRLSEHAFRLGTRALRGQASNSMGLGRVRGKWRTTQTSCYWCACVTAARAISVQDVATPKLKHMSFHF